MSDFCMPSLGADMEAGTLLEWRIKPGQAVKRGDIVAVIDTDKAVIDVEIWMDGVVENLVIEPGMKVPVGTVLAHIRTAAGAAAPAQAPAPAGKVEPPAQPPRAAAPPVQAAPVEVPAHAAAGLAHLRITPLARRMAQGLGIDAAALHGSGPGGAIVHTDVEQAAAGRAPQAGHPAAPQVGGGVRLRVSPLARRRARELGVDLTRVRGSGAEGAILQADVVRAAAAPEPGPASAAAPVRAAPTPPAPLTGADRAQAMRRAIAAAMTRSKREIPHYYLGLEIDLTKALAWLERTNQSRSIVDRLIYSVLLVKAVALAVHDVPEVNGFWRGDRFEPSAAVHPGVAISLRGGGLVAPALRNADQRPLGELMRDMRDLVSRARAYSLRSSEMSDPTLTITNLGEQGVDQVFGVIFPPQVALVGFGRVSPRRTLHASLAGDHRASDGHRGGIFLAAVERRLQAPETL